MRVVAGSVLLTGAVVATAVVAPGRVATGAPSLVSPAPGATSAPAPTTPPTPGRPPLPDKARLGALLRSSLNQPAMGSKPSVVVMDGATGTALYSSRGQQPATPASTAKLLTAAAALQVLGPTKQLPTRAMLSGPGQVTLVGGGDVFLGSGTNDSTRVLGRAGLSSLAEQTAAALKARHRQSVTLRLDDMQFPGIGTGQPLAPGWSAADVNDGFVAPVTSLAMNAGRLRNEHYAPRQTDPGLSAARVYADALRKRGITVSSTVRRARVHGSVPTLATVWSAPVSDVVDQVLANSDNNGADILARLVARSEGMSPTAPNGGAAVLDVVGRLGLRTDGLHLADGTGLARGSHLNAAVLADILYLAGKQSRVSTLLTSLPIAGLSGTLADRFSVAGQSRSWGVVRAKTGTLTGTSTLAGTVRDASGATLIFAVMTGKGSDALGARRYLDQAVTTLAGCGCR